MSELSSLAKAWTQESFSVLLGRRETFVWKPRWAGGRVNAQLGNLKAPGQDPCLDQRLPHPCLELGCGRGRVSGKESVLELGL